MNLTIHNKTILYIVFAGILLASCTEDDINPTVDAPETYEFENVKYSGQTTRIQLLDSLGKLINKAKLVKVTKQELMDIYENKEGLFTSQTDPTKYPQLKNKVAEGSSAQIEAWFQLVEDHSPMSGAVSTKNWFITPDGLDISQLVQKTLMGSVFYYRATYDYLDPIAESDNTTVVEGEGTAMEHHWDEAFGYYGAPADFSIYTADDILKKYRDTNNNGKQEIPSEKYYFHANYSLTRDEASKNFPAADQTNYRKELMDAFILGRAAIVAKDAAVRDEARTKIYDAWEKQTAASAISYMNKVKKAITENSASLDAIDTKYHEWAEGRGFLNALKYGINKKISDTDWNLVSGYLGEKPADTSVEELTSAIAKLQSVYGFSDHQAANF